METANFRAVCCRRAFKKTSGRRKSLRTTGCSSGFLEATRLTQSPFRASILLARPCKKAAGSSGAEGHVAVQAMGTSFRIKQFASATISGVLRTLPLITFCKVTKEFVTKSPSLLASEASISTNATTGGSSGVTFRTSTLLSFDSWLFETLSHNMKSGLKLCFQTFTSTPLPPPPAASPPPESSWRSMAMAFVELMRCKERSAFGAMPKDCGLSKSGICSTRERKSDMLVEPGMSNGGISMAELPFFLGPSIVSVLKKRAKYSLTKRESKSLSTRLP
mmetsp:Transcript_101985/g.255574  ORF Transcript_101985/g.255574 Transcript_101985/m.255574 type:complete len:277 (+) Transcript_101985:346-1176(+)